MEIKQAETRQDLLSLMAPPEGYQFDQGLGCAYSADSRTLQQLERILGMTPEPGTPLKTGTASASMCSRGSTRGSCSTASGWSPRKQAACTPRSSAWPTGIRAGLRWYG